MALIDPTTAIGMVRLRIADVSDVPYLSDTVIQSSLDNASGNVAKASTVCALYVLGIISQQVDRRMGLQLVVNGSQAYKAYKDFLLTTVSNPYLIDFSPIPWAAESCQLPDLVQFASDFKRNFIRNSESQQLAVDAAFSPNKGDLFGNLYLADTVTETSALNSDF